MERKRILSLLQSNFRYHSDFGIISLQARKIKFNFKSRIRKSYKFNNSSSFFSPFFPSGLLPSSVFVFFSYLLSVFRLFFLRCQPIISQWHQQHSAILTYSLNKAANPAYENHNLEKFLNECTRNVQDYISKFVVQKEILQRFFSSYFVFPSSFFNKILLPGEIIIQISSFLNLFFFLPFFCCFRSARSFVCSSIFFLSFLFPSFSVHQVNFLNNTRNT